MSEPKVLFEDHGDIAVIKLNRPEKRNALDQETVLLFNEYSEKAKDKKYRAVVIGGNGNAFCAGADLTAAQDNMGWKNTEDALNNGYHIGLNNLVYMDKVVIAAVEGPCAGIGCAYLLSSDIVMMSKSSFFQVGFSKIALIPDGGTNWLLPRVVGYQKAYRMAAEARRVLADECLELGICSEVCEDGATFDSAIALAKTYVEFAPKSIAKTKHLMRESFNKSYESNLQDEVKSQSDYWVVKIILKVSWPLLRRENQISLANNYIIENFSEHHLDDVMEIECQSNPTPWSKHTFEKILELRSISFVAIKDSTLIGFCIANKVLDECHLQNISVIEGMRRQGIGEFMLAVLLKRMKLSDLSTALLEVRRSNKAAQDFYRKNSFTELSVRKNYYQTKNGREDAIIMRLEVA